MKTNRILAILAILLLCSTTVLAYYDYGDSRTYESYERKYTFNQNEVVDSSESSSGYWGDCYDCGNSYRNDYSYSKSYSENWERYDKYEKRNYGYDARDSGYYYYRPHDYEYYDRWGDYHSPTYYRPYRREFYEWV